jgi:hypothetical protein
VKTVALTLLFLALTAGGALRRTPDDPGQERGPSTDPKAARLITTDIDNFWRALDQSTPETRKEVFDREYLLRGSPGLQDFLRSRIKSAETLAKTVNSHPRYYASIRESTLKVQTLAPKIRASFPVLKRLYDEAIFPDVYFLIGVMNSGGTTSSRALLIGTEMYGRTPSMPEDELSDWHKRVLRPIEDLPYIVAHELIHVQQKYPRLLNRTLLDGAITEGSADFLGELISGANINRHLHEYGNPREKLLWEEFKAVMDGRDYSKWLYNGVGSKDRPADLGYYVGYKITEAYYRKAAGKKQAIRDILNITDFSLFLKSSGYETKFAK